MEATISQADQVQNQRWSLRQKLVGIVISPRQTFEYLVENPDWVTPAVLSSFAAMFTSYIIMPKLLNASLKQASSEMLASAKNIILIVGLLTSTIAALTGLLVTALVLYSIGSLLRYTTVFKSAISVAGYASIPNILKSILTAVITLGTGQIFNAPSLSGAFSSNVDNFAKVFLATTDVFLIWSMFLYVFGIAALFRISIKKSTLVVVFLWLVIIIAQGLTNIQTST